LAAVAVIAPAADTASNSRRENMVEHPFAEFNLAEFNFIIQMAARHAGAIKLRFIVDENEWRGPPAVAALVRLPILAEAGNATPADIAARTLKANLVEVTGAIAMFEEPPPYHPDESCRSTR
jgi:hypothetical protein